MVDFPDPVRGFRRGVVASPCLQISLIHESSVTLLLYVRRKVINLSINSHFFTSENWLNNSFNKKTKFFFTKCNNSEWRGVIANAAGLTCRGVFEREAAVERYSYRCEWDGGRAWTEETTMERGCNAGAITIGRMSVVAGISAAVLSRMKYRKRCAFRNSIFCFAGQIRYLLGLC